MLTLKLTNRPNRRRGAKLAALVAVPLLIGMLAACSTGASSDEPDSSGAGAKSEQTFEDWQLDFASCMRGEGIDMPDPTDEGMQAMTLDEGGAGAFQAANEACTAEIGDPPTPPGGKMTEEEQLESQLELAGCLRENGLDVADPLPGQGMTLPQDISEEILKVCLPGAAAGGGGAVSVAPAG